MKMISSLLAMVLLLAFAASGFAQEGDEEYEKDFMEVALFGGYSIPSGGLADWTVTMPDADPVGLGANGGVSLGGDLGYFLTEDLVLGLSIAYSQYSLKGSAAVADTLHHRTLGTHLYLKRWFFGESNFAPFVSGHLGLDVYKFTTRVFDRNVDDGSWVYRELSYKPAFAYGLGVGATYYTHDYGGPYFEVYYHRAQTSDIQGSFDGRDYDFDETGGLLDFKVGIMVFFAGGE